MNEMYLYKMRKTQEYLNKTKKNQRIHNTRGRSLAIARYITNLTKRAAELMHENIKNGFF